jgi:hypothetical protein
VRSPNFFDIFLNLFLQVESTAILAWTLFGRSDKRMLS